MVNRFTRALAGLAWVLVATGVGGAWAAADDLLLNERHVAILRSATTVAVSPDGTWIAYTLEVPRGLAADPTGPPYVELHLTDLQGNSRAFQTGPVRVSHVRWRPDGSGLTFLAYRDGEAAAALYGMPVDGGEAQRLIELPAEIREYAWRPDGRQVAFVTASPSSSPSASTATGWQPLVSDAISEFDQLWVADAANGRFLAPRPVALPGQPSGLEFSPDGGKLLLALAPSKRDEDILLNRSLQVWDLATGQALAQIANRGKLGPAHWSPDGQSIVFCSAGVETNPLAGQLYAAPATGGPAAPLLADYQPNILDFCWSNPRTLQFIAEDGCLTVWGSSETGGGPPTPVFGPNIPILSAFSLHAGGAVVAFCAAAPEHPAEVFAFENGQLRRLTHSNPWLDDLALGRQETVRFRARDNASIEGVLVYPTPYDANRRYPLIVVAHDGPATSIANGWVTSYAAPGQVAAGRGFFVFYPNYRGSSGRGSGFIQEAQGELAGRELNDILDGIDHLNSLGLIDPAKVGITGVGYGGFLTAWCCTFYSSRFAAGVTLGGITDHLAHAGATDRPQATFQLQTRKRIWEDWQYFLERSPLRYVEQAQTALLLAHGREDRQVPVEQSLELYQQLQVLARAPVRLVQYPQEGHNLVGPQARYDYNLRMMQWFEHYLRGGGNGLPPAEVLPPVDEAHGPEGDPASPNRELSPRTRAR